MIILLTFHDHLIIAVHRTTMAAIRPDEKNLQTVIFGTFQCDMRTLSDTPSDGTESRAKPLRMVRIKHTCAV
jgi:hypothetical protein